MVKEFTLLGSPESKRMKFLETVTKFKLSISTAVVALVICAFGYINSYDDPLISFLIFELFFLQSVSSKNYIRF
ncbi:hypothetical protein A9Q83_01150 [Alphaproteobacteria bacterium 46_93_T64]|nr:hypothetical protein A9Q83_01150 [Alphaproteobacteria bacterium 46_93_T64]